MTSLTWDRHKGHALSYDVTALGYNYRLDEMHSALGLVQLQALPERNNASRRELTGPTTACARQIPESTVPFQQPRGTSTATSCR